MNARTALDSKVFKVIGTRPLRPDGADKVTGRAAFGADLMLPGMLEARMKRSPHAHARILSIDASAALAMPGVKAVVTSADFIDLEDVEAHVGESNATFRDICRNVMARDKALYVGHAVAAVAAAAAVVAAVVEVAAGVPALICWTPAMDICELPTVR